MFRLLRYFSIASLISMVLAAAALGAFYRQIATRHLLELGEGNNVALTQTLANAVWPQLHGFAEAAGPLDTETLRRHPAIAGVRRSVVAQMRDTKMVKVKLYSLDGRTLFSSEAKQIGEDESHNAGFLSARQDGRPASSPIATSSAPSTRCLRTATCCRVTWRCAAPPRRRSKACWRCTPTSPACWAA